MFIVFEGIDGSGKTSQVKKLGKYLSKEYDVVLTKEPTAGVIGKLIKNILAGKEQVDPKTLALLFTADRYEHLKNEIIPALNEEKIVICDRYYYSTLVYQMAQGVDETWIKELNKYALVPNVTFFLDIQPDIALERTNQTDIFETKEFLNKIYDQYWAYNLIRVNANRTKEEIANEIIEVTELMMVLKK